MHLKYASNSKFLLLSLLFIQKLIFLQLSSTVSNFNLQNKKGEGAGEERRRKGRRGEEEEGTGRRVEEEGMEGRREGQEHILYSYLGFTDLQ